MKIDKFVLSMLVAVLLSFLAPWLGAKNSPLHLSLVTKWGVALVFFLHGANLSFDAIKSGASNWRLHLFIQSCTFILYPLIGFAFFYLAKDFVSFPVRLGFFYLCALSSTISSSVTLTGIGKGNVAGAVFDATISGILGIFITPFLVSIIMQDANLGHFDIKNAIFDVAKTLLLPFVLGQIFRPIILKPITKHKKIIGFVDKSVLVLIVFVAFCNANYDKIWAKIAPVEIIIILISIISLLAFVLFVTIEAAKIFGFSHQDKVAGVFCGVTKSLANGAPIAAILFASSPYLGIILIPIMIYHQSQLIACSILAGKWGKNHSISN